MSAADGAERGRRLSSMVTVLEFESGVTVRIVDGTALVPDGSTVGVTCWRGPFRWEIGGPLLCDAAEPGEVVALPDVRCGARSDVQSGVRSDDRVRSSVVVRRRG